MKAVLQRVIRASVTLKATGEKREIGPGMVVLLGAAPGDTPQDARWLAEKLVGLRVFEDDAGKMNRALTDILADNQSGAMLIVSQFTLLGDARKGRRPSFTGAAPPEIAAPLYQRFVAEVRRLGIPIQTGEFGADMLLEIANDGPVTLLVESPGASAGP